MAIPTDKSFIRSLSNYVCSLDIKEPFDNLTLKEKLYAHHMARAAWHGTRIILRQVSPESIAIFDFILEVYRSCDGDWSKLAIQVNVSHESLTNFLGYAAVFLANIGNYYGKGDQKIVPETSIDDLQKISTVSEAASRLYQEFSHSILARPPHNLGFPSDIAQSTYYPGESRISRDEISLITKAMEKHSIYPENTRLHKHYNNGKLSFDILQASVEVDGPAQELSLPGSGEFARLLRGDHSQELEKICSCLEEALKYAANTRQSQTISKYLVSFRTGDMEAYRESQRIWVKDMKPAVENILGFVEPYRDPFGVRAEFEGVVGIVDAEETRVLTTLTENSTFFIRRLPWAEGHTENDGKGPFEKDLFHPPDFTSLHALAYCSSIIFLGINLPNFNDIRQTTGFKNVMITNRHKSVMRPPNTSLIAEPELATYDAHKLPAWRLQITLHELLGHGTSKLLAQEGPGRYNFDISSPPINPLTGKPIEKWYLPGETWTGVFGSLATTVDECRAECVGSYLMADKDLLALFGYTDDSEITADDLTYNLYLQLGAIGLRSLANYITEDNAHFAMFRSLLAAGSNLLTVQHSLSAKTLRITLDRTKILSHGRPAIGSLLLKLHIYRCTADIEGCRAFYEELTKVDGVALEWRSIVMANQSPRQIFVQGNTFLDDEAGVRLREYEPTPEGLIRSWAERQV
ncbi:hypothetical protein FGG08_001141 [Glutinoglossum americanum]|uniref:Dipeptidyl peptidase 3 n=1 Tax=Glutinoglossum americanum TaxID=1670608 RepID=A0A9P8I7J6_9PEZI|nr:hypothetical protein FGG08_001141 [Glutinoglossum americanum]